MFGSAIVDIAIGIVFIFLLVSVIASTINEIILSFLNMRGKELLAGLQMLLDDAGSSGLVAKLYNHGQIYGLFKGPFDPNKPGNLPSYIPSRNFVRAFLDIIRPAVPATSATDLSQDAALFQSLRAAAQTLAENPQTEKVGKPLITLLDEAGNNVAKLKTSLEDWFNGVMDRVSGWYKYRTQKNLLVIGLVLAVAMNVDTINILRQLSKDSALRQSIVAAAGAAGAPEPLGSQIDLLKTQVNDVTNLGIPIGWNHVPDVLKTGAWHWRYVNTALGWLVTAIAISLGAPFWFDMLNKIMVVRSTVKPREKSQEEPSKDT